MGDSKELIENKDNEDDVNGSKSQEFIQDTDDKSLLEGKLELLNTELRTQEGEILQVENLISSNLKVDNGEQIGELKTTEEGYEGECEYYDSFHEEEDESRIGPKTSELSETEEYETECEGEYDTEFQYHYEGGETGYSPTEGELENVLQEEEEEESSTSSISQIYSKLSPYFIKWSFGLRTFTKLINLTKGEQFEVFYVSSHFGVIYDYRKNSMRFLPGHNSLISSIAADVTGRWLVTADDGEDNVIIIWDHERGVPCWSLYNIFSSLGTKCVQISQDARFLVAISGGSSQKCKFYMWTYGRDEADGELDLDSSYGAAVHIQFNHLITEQFVITMENGIIFCQWRPEKKTLEQFTSNQLMRKKKTGLFIETIFLDDNHSVITSTNTGHIVIWCDKWCLDVKSLDNKRADIETTGNLEKKYIKSIKIHLTAITSMQLVDQVVVTSSEEGVIAFHDQNLSLLYWMPRYTFEPILSVSFNLTQQQPDQMDPFSDEFNDLQSSKRSTSEEEIKDIPEKYLDSEYKREKDHSDEDGPYSNQDSKPKAIVQGIDKPNIHVPSDCTIEMKPFYMRDFIFLNKNGKFGYCSHFRTKVRYFLYVCDVPILAIDCNPNKAHLVAGNAAGRIDLYEHKSKKLLVSNVVASLGITLLKYSPTGRYLVAGLQNGTTLLLDPLLLTVHLRMKISKSQIVKMCFSSNERLVAFFDKENLVYLYRTNKLKKWIFIGGYKSHYKETKDIMFDEVYMSEDKERIPRLLTIGEDRMLVEYDTRNLIPEGGMTLKSVDRIEQTALPLCFMTLPTSGSEAYIMIANNEYKMKIIERNTRTCTKTTVGPIGDTPLNFMKVIPNGGQSSKSQRMIYKTEKHIGLKLLPATGNPFEGIGMVGHPVKISGIGISYDFKHVFTIGLNDSSILMWKVNSKSVDVAFQLGGTGVEPYMTLMEGGANGYLIKELEDFFYYSQIIHQGEHANLDRSVSKTLALCEIPDLLRAVGYFPTDYEIDNINYELMHLNDGETGKMKNEVTFEECVKIFVNHRPVHGISLESINKALLTVADLSDPSCILIEKKELYRLLEEHGEAMPHEEVLGYLRILLLPKDENEPVPEAMTLKDFTNDVLGIDFSLTEDRVRDVVHPSETKPRQPGDIIN